MVSGIEGLQELTRRHYDRSCKLWTEARAIVESANGDILSSHRCAVELNDRAIEAMRRAINTEAFVNKYIAQNK